MACLQVKLHVAISERFGKYYSIYRRFTNVQVYFTFYFTYEASSLLKNVVVAS